MAESPRFLSPQTLAKLRGLHLRARHIVEGYVAGLHRSPYRGYSIEFAEHRDYVPGDDLRYVDWKLYGRTDKYYLKQFEDETNLLCYLLLDSSESMRYQGPAAALSKFEYAQCLAAALAWLVLRQQDAVGLVTFDSQVRTHVRPGNHPSHLRELLQALESAQPAARTSLGPVFHELAERLTKRGVIVILSDLLDDVPSLLAGLKHFHHRRHDVIAFHVLDAAEIDFPFNQPTLFRGLEGLPDLVADPRSLQRAYLQEFHDYLRGLKHGCTRQGIDYQLLPTQQPFDTALSAFLTRRMTRVK